MRLSQREWVILAFCAGSLLTSMYGFWARPANQAPWGTVEAFCRPDQLSERGACELTEFVPDLPPTLTVGRAARRGILRLGKGSIAAPLSDTVPNPCRYPGKTTAMSNWRENQCVNAYYREHSR